MFAKLFNVNYKVEHWVQNVFDDEYMRLNDFEMVCASIAGTNVGTGYNGQPYAKERVGFDALDFNANTPISIDGSTVLKIYYDRLYYLMNFELGDGGYGVNPIYARYGASIPKNLIPKRAGYVFNGWNPTLPETMPAENKTYTACWEIGATEVDVNIIFWYENANDSNYTYAGSKKIKETYSEEKTVKPSKYKDEDFAGKDKYHFIFNSSKDAEVVLKSDGSSIVNVYFKRKTYKLVFFNCRQSGHITDMNSCYASTGVEAFEYVKDKPDCVDQYLNPDGNGPLVWGVSIYTRKWQEDVSKLWQDGIAGREAGRRWRPYFDNCISEETGKAIYSAGVGMMNVMPDTNVVFRFLSNGNCECTMHYWVEPKAGETYTKTYEGRNYLEKYKFVCKFGDITETEEYVDIEGFTKVYKWEELINKEQITTSENTRTAHFYYSRNSYPLAYISGGKTIKTVQVKFEDKLDGSTNNSNFIPTIPDGWDASAYKFGGWYLSENCASGTEVNWNSHAMPINGIAVYAKWEHMIHTVTIEGEGITTQSFIVQHDKKVVNAPKNPTRDGYSFVSWFYVDENGNEIAFTFDMPITEDITVYAKWKEDIVTNSTDFQDE